MDHNPWSAYNQHYSHLGASGNPQSPSSELNLPPSLARQDTSGYGGSTSAHHPLFLSTHHGINASQTPHPDAFNAMNLLSPNFDSPLLSSFQHSAKSHFSSLSPSHASNFFKSVSKDDLADLRGGFSYRGSIQESPLGISGNSSLGSSAVFEAHSSGNSWRPPPLPATSCGPFGILPHEAVMQNGEKQQQRPNRSFTDSEMSRNYPGILPSPSRPPSSFLDHNSVPHTATLGSQGDSQYFSTVSDSYYSCTNKSSSGVFTPFNSSLSPSISSPSSVSQQNFPSYTVESKDNKTPGSSTSMEPFSPNSSVIQLQGHNGQSSSSTSSSVSSRPGVIGTPGSTVCQNSPAPQHQSSPHMPSYNQLQSYPYPSPSSQHSMSPSVVQSPQHQPQQDSRGLTHNFIGSNQPSPSVHHSPYPAMNTPAPASTPAHITPPSSIGQAYCPMLPDSSPHCTSVITVPSCSSANFSSVPSMSPKDVVVPPQHIPPSDSHLDNAHYMSPVGISPHGNMHKDMINMVGNVMGSQRGTSNKNLLDNELSAIDAMVEKHQGASIGQSSHIAMPHAMGPAKASIEMENLYHSRAITMHNDYGSMETPKESLMEHSHHSMADTGLHPAIADFQTIPTTRKRGRGRPRGSVNKRGRRARRSRRGSNTFCERERYIPDEPISPIPEMDEVGGSLRNTYSSRLHISRAPHNRVFATRKDNCNMGYNLMDNKPDLHQMRGAQYMPMSHYDSGGIEGEYQGVSGNQNMGEVDDTKVFNFEEQATSEFTPYSKFMSQARGESSSHHLSQQHSHSMNSARAMMMDSCMTDNKCQPSSEFLGVKAEVDDLGLLSPSLSSTASGSNQHHQQNELKQKNYMSIEDDLGFLAELPPIEPEPLTSDPNGNKSASKDPGGFLQSFLSFIEGSTEPSTATDPTGGVSPTSGASVSSRGRRGAVRGRRGRGARGRSTGRRRGEIDIDGHSSDQRPYHWAGQNTTGLNDGYLEQSSVPPDIDLGDGRLLHGVDYQESGSVHKDTMVPNPEAPSFSSDDEDNTSGGIADSVAFVIRRLSEDEPPTANGKTESRKIVKESRKLEVKRSDQVNGNSAQFSEQTLSSTNLINVQREKNITAYRKRGRKPKTQIFQCHNSNGLKTKITLSSYKPVAQPMKSTVNDSENMPEGVTSPRRSTSMRKCKVEMMKKREEKLKKKKEPEEGKPDVIGGNSSGEDGDAAEESDSDPAWTPGSRPADAPKASLSQNHKNDSSSKRKGHRKLNILNLPQKLSLKFKSDKAVNGENGRNTPGIIHLLKEGKIYTRVSEEVKGNGCNENILLAPMIQQVAGKCEQDIDEDSGNDSDSSSGSSFKDETGSRTLNDEDDILQGFFRTGDFVISKTEVEICGAPLWQIEGKSLLQRFDTFEKDGRILYRNASTYSAWNPSLKSKFLGVTVRLLYSSRAYTIVEYLGLSSTDIPELNSLSDEPVYGHPERENFEVFLQTLISQVLDPNFITEIFKENDDYFLSHLKVIDEVTHDKKTSLSDPNWDYHLKECAELYPCLTVSVVNYENTQETLKENCKLCQKNSMAQHMMEFYGQPYDFLTLSNRGPMVGATKGFTFVLCDECMQAVVLYHRLHHHKYNFFLKCHLKVALERSMNVMKESHVILENCLQDTLWVNEMFCEMQEMWSTCEKPR